MNADFIKLGHRLKNRTVIVESGCHEWQGAKDARGYGFIRFDGRQVRTHRAALAVSLNMPKLLLPQSNTGWQGTYALHSCDNPSCINPSHLRLGSADDNSADMVARGRTLKINLKLPRKVDADAVRDIRAMAQTWDGMCDMMKKYRITQATVEGIAAGKTHKHVE